MTSIDKNSDFKLPEINHLKDYELNNIILTTKELNENKNKITEIFKNYKINISDILTTIGPSITLYEIILAPGVRISRVRNLQDDIILSFANRGIRIIVPVRGKGTIGIEIPNQNPQTVSLRSTISSENFQKSKFELPIILGKTINNKTYIIDLTKAPHILIGGKDKSMGINTILTSLLYKKLPEELKVVLISPKKELSIYSKIEKHYLAKLPEEEAVITDTRKAVSVLDALGKEMDARFDLLKNANVRNIVEYNQKTNSDYLPYIVVVIDELADLIMDAGKDAEISIARVAQLARATGIHLVIATQQQDVVTGMIKANFPTRIAFRVTQSFLSRIILDTHGAEQLKNDGDMLISQGGEDLIRLQCPIIETSEIENILTHISEQESYSTTLILPKPDEKSWELDTKKRDELFEESANMFVANQQALTSDLQKRLSIGYNRASRIMDQLEILKIIGPYEGNKAREVLVPNAYTLKQILNLLN